MAKSQNPFTVTKFDDRSLTENLLYENVISLVGTGERPAFPRDVRTVSGARKVLVIWSTNGDANIAKWRIYKNTEDNLYKEIDRKSVV